MNIVERSKADVRFWTRHLKELREVGRMVNSLPKNIKELDATVETDYAGGVTLVFRYDLPEAREVFRKHGVREWKRSFSSYDGSYALKAKVVINDVTIAVTLQGIDKPSNCHVEPQNETVIRYKSICGDEEE